MQIALISDVHFGARSENDRIAEHQKKFFRDVFFPYLIKYKIDTIFILGDVFERRKYINFKSLYLAEKMFFNQALELGLKLHVMMGNHDVVSYDTSEINSIDLLLEKYSNVIKYTDKPTEVKFDNLWIGVLPWITSENRDVSLNFLRSCLCPIIFGHFDINGFEMNPGIECKNGEDPMIFSRYEAVYTGHYHKKSSKGNIHYLGSQYDTDWNDYGVGKYFHVLDTETKKLTAVENPNKLFVKIYYRNGLVESNVDISGKFVKLVVLEKGDIIAFDKCVTTLKDQHPESFSVIENLIEGEEGSVSVENKPIYTIMDDYVTEMKNITAEHKESVKSLLKDLYVEAIAAGS